MKNFKKAYSLGIVSFILLIGTVTYAATTPALGEVETFGILASTYSNTIAGTTINGDVGYTTTPTWMPTIIGFTYVADSTYNQAGIDQNAVLSALNAQTCTFTFPGTGTNIATDTSHGTIGVYEPGVYCTVGAAQIGTAGITLSGAGTYIFKIDGALDTVAGSIITVSNGASACDVFWTATSATTLGANSTFIGTIIDAAGITIGSTVTGLGRMLSFGGTISTNASIITVPICGVGTANLNVIKNVVNIGGGTANSSDFVLSVHTISGVFVGSGLGAGSPGTSYTGLSGKYIVSESSNPSYKQSFSGSCSSTGLIKLAGMNRTCTITNTYIVPTPSGGGGATLTMDVCLSGDYSPSYYDDICGIEPIVTGEVTEVIIPVTIQTGDTPKLPNTGIAPTRNNLGLIYISLSIIAGVFFIYTIAKKREITK